MSVIWITGLSGAGKTTLGKCLREKLTKYGQEYILLDGDELREVFKLSEVNKFNHSREIRLDLALKYASLVKMLTKKNIKVIIATISMFEELYKWNRENLEDYTLVHLKISLKRLIKRDSKKIYSRYFNGELNNVSGLDLKVDEPKDADLILNSDNLDTNSLAEKVIEHIKSKNHE